MIKRITLAMMILPLTACSVFGFLTVEEPDYSIILKDENFEIRSYDKLLVVETTVEKDHEEASNIAFRRLFKYITGNNKKETKINMTAPVGMIPSGQKLDKPEAYFTQRTSKGWKMSFVLPSSFNITNAPEPLDKKVTLREIDAQKIAVLSFAGRWSLSNFDENSELLIQKLNKEKIKFNESTLRIAAYNPPWTIPFLRRNEIHVTILE